MLQLPGLGMRLGCIIQTQMLGDVPLHHRDQTDFMQEMFINIDHSYPCSDPTYCCAKPGSVSTSSMPVAQDANSFTVCELAMQSLCQHLSPFPEYGRLSQAELSLSVTQPLTIAKCLGK